LNNYKATIGCSNRVAIEKREEISCINVLCLKLVVENAMELVKGGEIEYPKVWKEREALANIELVTHILKFYVTSINFFLNVHILKISMLSNISP
jgi:hypothetical protein